MHFDDNYIFYTNPIFKINKAQKKYILLLNNLSNENQWYMKKEILEETLQNLLKII